MNDNPLCACGHYKDDHDRRLEGADTCRGPVPEWMDDDRCDCDKYELNRRPLVATRQRRWWSR